MDGQQLVEVLRAAGIPHRGQARRNLSISCPFARWRSPPHSTGADRSPSLSIKVNPGGLSPFFCWTCEEKGILVHMLERLEDLSGTPLSEALMLARKYEGQAADRLVRDLRGEKPPPVPEPGGPPLDLIRSFLLKIPQYALDRGLTLATCKAWYLGLDDSSGFVRKYGGPRLVFPVRDEVGKLVGAQGRLIGEKDDRGGKYVNYDFPKENYLYGEHVCAKAVRESERKAFILTEGPVDVLMTNQHGVPWVGGTMGKTVSVVQRDKVLSWGTRTVFLGYDGDAAGCMAAEKASRMFTGRALVYRMAIPEQSDLGGMMRKEQLEEALARAFPFHFCED